MPIYNMQRIKTVEDDVLIVGIEGLNGSYLMWQKGLSEYTGINDGIYFEMNDQIHCGYNLVKECTMDSEGVTLSLVNGESVKFLFPPGFDAQLELKQGLREIYQGAEHVLRFSI
jgi:hypothetical protein